MNLRPFLGRRVATLCVCLGLSLLALPARAVPVLHGDFSPPGGAHFEDVTEDAPLDPTPLYGAPTDFSVGLNFSPTSFAASAGGNLADFTIGVLTFDMTTDSNFGIMSLSLQESGTYGFTGTGVFGTHANVGFGLTVKIVAVDGVTLATPLNVGATDSASFNILANPGTGNPWTLSGSVDLDAALTTASMPYTRGATEVSVSLTNSLGVTSEPNSLTSIAKSQVYLSATMREVSATSVPEMSSLLLVGGAMALAGAWRAVRRTPAVS